MYRIKSVEKTGGKYAVRVEGTKDGTGIFERYLVASEFFLPLGIAEGDLIDGASFDALSAADSLTAAVSKALDVLSYSNVSRKALTEKLRYKYRIGKEEAQRAADYAAERGYLDEDIQAARIAESDVRGKLWGRRRVVAELFAKGYPKEVAKRAADGISDADYRAALEKLIDKKVKNAPQDAAGYNKLISSLIRLGHSPSAIKEALSEKFGAEI